MWGGDPSAASSPDSDSAFDRIAGWQQRLEQMALDANAMRDRLQDARITVADANGLVEVTIDFTGRLMDLKLTERIRRASPEALARTIMQTIAVAGERMGERTNQIIGETMGTDSAAGREIAEQVGQRLRMPEPPAGDDSGQKWR